MYFVRDTSQADWVWLGLNNQQWIVFEVKWFENIQHQNSTLKKFIQNENMATGNNKILKINGLLLHFTDSYNTVKNIVRLAAFLLSLFITSDIWREYVTKITSIFLVPLQKVFSERPKVLIRSFQGTGETIKLKSSSNAVSLNKLLVSTRLKISNSCDSPPVASSREREGCSGTEKGQH